MQCETFCHCLLQKPVNLVALFVRKLASVLQVLNLGKEKKNIFLLHGLPLPKGATGKICKIRCIFFYSVKLASLLLQDQPQYNSHMGRNTLVGNYQHGPADVFLLCALCTLRNLNLFDFITNTKGQSIYSDYSLKYAMELRSPACAE